MIRETSTLYHERLDVYRLAVEFHVFAMKLVARGGIRHIRDQLERASLSIVLCIAEGTGRTSPKDKKRFYSMARGSATECAALLDILEARNIVPTPRCEQGHAMVIRLVQMLTRMTRQKT